LVSVSDPLDWPDYAVALTDVDICTLLDCHHLAIHFEDDAIDFLAVGRDAYSLSDILAAFKQHNAYMGKASENISSPVMTSW
jgi:hypothetical protein